MYVCMYTCMYVYTSAISCCMAPKMGPVHDARRVLNKSSGYVAHVAMAPAQPPVWSVCNHA